MAELDGATERLVALCAPSRWRPIARRRWFRAMADLGPLDWQAAREADAAWIDANIGPILAAVSTDLDGNDDE